MTLKLSGRVAAVMVVPEGEPIMATEQQTVRVTLAGFEGDRHASLTQRSTGRTPHYPRGTEIRNSRQVSLVSTEELAEIAQRLGVPHVAAQWLGANLLIEGIPRLTFLPRGTRLFFPNDAALVVQGENLPCTLAGEAIQVQYPAIDGIAARFPSEALHLRGLVAWVECAGSINVGDGVAVEVPDQVIYPAD